MKALHESHASASAVTHAVVDLSQTPEFTDNVQNIVSITEEVTGLEPLSRYFVHDLSQEGSLTHPGILAPRGGLEKW